MEISSIPEADEYYEADASVNSGKSLDLSRTNLSFVEDEQLYDIYAIETILSRYTQLALALLLSLSLYWAVSIGFFTYSILLIPLTLLECKFLIESSMKVKEEYAIIQYIFKNENFSEILESLSSILAYFFIMLYIESYLPLLSISSIPFFLICIIRFLIKTSNSTNCGSFNSICKSLGRWLKVFFLLSIDLKLTNTLNQSWIIILWPVWILIFIWSAISLASITFTLLSLFSKSESKPPLPPTLWLLYTFLTGSCLLFFETFSFLQSFSINALLPIPYLLGFIALTLLYKKTIAYWWWDFFSSEDSGQLPITFNEVTPLPLPTSQAVYMASFANKLTNAIKFTPKALVKMNRPKFWAEGEEEQKSQRKGHSRANSYQVGFERKRGHARSRSSDNRVDVKGIGRDYESKSFEVNDQEDWKIGRLKEIKEEEERTQEVEADKSNRNRAKEFARSFAEME